MAKRNSGDAPQLPLTQAAAPMAAPTIPPAPVAAQQVPVAPTMAAPVVPTAPAMVAPIAPVAPMAQSLPPTLQADAGQNALNELEQAVVNAAPVFVPGQQQGGLFGNIDLSNVKTGGNYRLLPVEYTYEAEVKECESKMSSTSQPMLAVVLEIVHPPEYAGSLINDYIVAGGDNPWKFKMFSDACDLLDPSGSRCTAQNVTDFLENVVRFNVLHEPYNGTARSKVDGGYMKPEVTAVG